MRKLNFINLFGVAGGLLEGFIRAGFKPIAHVEMNKNTCDNIKTITAYHWLIGVKQSWLSKQLDNSYNMVNSYVQNIQQPRLELLNDIVKILDVDVVELIVSSKKK